MFCRYSIQTENERSDFDESMTVDSDGVISDEPILPMIVDSPEEVLLKKPVFEEKSCQTGFEEIFDAAANFTLIDILCSDKAMNSCAGLHSL